MFKEEVEWVCTWHEWYFIFSVQKMSSCREEAVSAATIDLEEEEDSNSVEGGKSEAIA